MLEWTESVALGLVRGAHIFRVTQQRPRRWGLLPGRTQTQVTLSQEVAGASPSSLGSMHSNGFFGLLKSERVANAALQT